MVVALNREHGKAVFFDLDDTLLRTSDVYARCREQFVRLMVAEGWRRECVISLFEQIDAHNMKVHGYSPERYGVSMRQTYDALTSATAIRTRAPIERSIDQTACLVADVVPDIVPGAEAALADMRESFPLHLVTRGIRDWQHRKIEETGLGAFFQSCHVVAYKTPRTLLSIMRQLQLRPAEVCSVGDSVKADVNPALLLGATAVWIPYRLPHYQWIQDVEEPLSGNYLVADSITDVPLLVQELLGPPD